MELVLKLPSPNASASLARVSGVSCLHHEVLDIAVDEVVIVIAAGTQGKEILRGTDGE